MKVKSTFLMKIKNLIAILSQLAMYSYLIFNWNNIPKILLAADSPMTRGELLVFPILVTVFFIVFSVIELFPSAWNTLSNAKAANIAQLLHITKNLIVDLKLVVCFVLGLLFMSIVFAFTMPVWLATLSIVGTLVYYVLKIIKASK